MTTPGPSPTSNETVKAARATTRETMSPLGRDLMEIAAEIEASEEEPMDEDALERELIRRRGGYSENGG